MKTFHRTCIVANLVLAATATAANAEAADDTPPNCIADSAFHVLDFWIGRWNVVDSTGAAVGTNQIESILGGCAITETWRDAAGGDGRSLFYYVPAQRQWKQVWVTPEATMPGGMKEKHLIAQSAEGVRFQGELIGPRGGLIVDRTTLTRLSGGRVRQLIEISRDGGTSWLATFDAIYVPAAQTRGFVVRLGADTFAIERIRRDGNTVEGAVVRHTPTTTVLRYSITFRPDSSIAVYQESIFNADGTPVAPSPQGISQSGMKMTFVGDSVVREVTQNGASVVKRDAAPRGTVPMAGGASPYWQELVLQAVKRNGATQIGAYGFALGQTSPNMFPVQFIGGDSAEIMLGQGFRRGYRLDHAGQLIHGDASNTTVRLQMTPIRDADIDAIARAWAAKDAAGQGMGLASSRDTATATLGGANIWIDYGRPAKRGRTIWGKLVPFDTVWRLGANFPTQFHTDKDLDLGGVTVPAGAYSLWLVPSAGQSYLLVNKQTAGWVGVPMHDASQDLFKVPVRKHVGPPAGEERFRILFQNGMLMMLWDDGGYEVPIRVK